VDATKPCKYRDPGMPFPQHFPENEINLLP
jgi:hypothetical protein